MANLVDVVTKWVGPSYYLQLQVDISRGDWRVGATNVQSLCVREMRVSGCGGHDGIMSDNRVVCVYKAAELS